MCDQVNRISHWKNPAGKSNWLQSFLPGWGARSVGGHLRCAAHRLQGVPSGQVSASQRGKGTFDLFAGRNCLTLQLLLGQSLLIGELHQNPKFTFDCVLLNSRLGLGWDRRARIQLGRVHFGVDTFWENLYFLKYSGSGFSLLNKCATTSSSGRQSESSESYNFLLHTLRYQHVDPTDILDV